MKAFIETFLQRIRLKNPREIKMILAALLCSLLFTVLFQIYLAASHFPLKRENGAQHEPDRGLAE